MASKTIQLQAQNRDELGSRANKRLREKGLIPAVIYGHKEAVVTVALNKRELATHLAHGAHVFELSLAGKAEPVLVKEVQYDHLGAEPIHIDFARVSLDERVKVTVAIELKGEPKGQAEGGVLTQVLNEVEIECVVTDIPDVIRHSVSDMNLDDVLHLRDLKLPQGVILVDDAELIVATVKEVQEEVTTPEVAEGAAEPEIIGRKAEDEAAAEGAGEEKK